MNDDWIGSGTIAIVERGVFQEKQTMPARDALRFAGSHIDPVIWGYQLGNGYRAYLPSLMRFNTPDSLSPFGAGGPNPYVYCDGEPLNRIDPSGHMELDPASLETLQRAVADASEDATPRVRAPHVVVPGTDQPIGAAHAAQNAAPSSSGPTPRSNSTPIPRQSQAMPSVADANNVDSVVEWRRKISSQEDHERRENIAAAKALLYKPRPYELGPFFKVVPRYAWAQRGYRETVTIGWEEKVELRTIQIFAHVHYSWNRGVWTKIPGNAWIPGVLDWQHPTTPAVLRLAPFPPNRGPW